jgi:hypothetical protein
MEERELEMLKRVFYRSFNFNNNINDCFYSVMGDFPSGETLIQEALYIAKIFKMDIEETEQLIKKVV